MDRGQVLDSRVGNFLTSESEIELGAETSRCVQPPANRRAAGQQLTREGAVRRTGW